MASEIGNAFPLLGAEKRADWATGRLAMIVLAKPGNADRPAPPFQGRICQALIGDTDWAIWSISQPPCIGQPGKFQMPGFPGPLLPRPGKFAPRGVNCRCPPF